MWNAGPGEEHHVTHVLVAVAGALGALARYGLGILLGPQAFPVATLTVNAVGSLALGFVTAMVVARGGAASPAVVALSVGFLGAFTTFSTFCVEALELLQSGHGGAAVIYVAGSVALGLSAAFLGYTLAGLW